MISSNDHRIGLDQRQELSVFQRKCPREAVKVHFEADFWFQAKLTIIFVGLEEKGAWRASYGMGLAYDRRGFCIQTFEAQKKVTGGGISFNGFN